MTRAGTARRRHAERRGHAAETLALLFMLAKFYWPVARRVKTPRGEIDLIMRRGRQLVLVEVKARATLTSGIEAIHAQQQRRIIDAFHYWLAKHPSLSECAVRCDAVVIAPRMLPRHIRNAFSL